MILKTCVLVVCLAAAIQAAPDLVVGLPISPKGCPAMMSYFSKCPGHFTAFDSNDAWTDNKGSVLTFDDNSRRMLCCSADNYKDGACAEHGLLAEGIAEEHTLCALTDQYCPELNISVGPCAGQYVQSTPSSWFTTTTPPRIVVATRNYDTGALEFSCPDSAIPADPTQYTCLNPLYPSGVLYGLNTPASTATGPLAKYVYITKIGANFLPYPSPSAVGAEADDVVRLGGEGGTDTTAHTAVQYPKLTTVQIDLQTDAALQGVTVYNRDRFHDMARGDAVVIGQMANRCAACCGLKVNHCSYAAFSVTIEVCAGSTPAAGAVETLRFLMAPRGTAEAPHFKLVADTAYVNDSTQPVVMHFDDTSVPSVFVQAWDIVEASSSSSSGEYVYAAVQDTVGGAAKLALASGVGAMPHGLRGVVHMIALVPNSTAPIAVPYFDSTFIISERTGNVGDTNTYEGLNSTPFIIGGSQAHTSNTYAVARLDTVDMHTAKFILGGMCKATALTEPAAYLAIGKVDNVKMCQTTTCDGPTHTGTCREVDAAPECECKPGLGHPINDRLQCKDLCAIDPCPKSFALTGECVSDARIGYRCVCQLGYEHFEGKRECVGAAAVLWTPLWAIAAVLTILA